MLNAERLRPKDQSSSLSAGQAIGQVISVRGSRASVGLTPALQDSSGVRPTVGKFLGVCAGQSLLVGVITHVSETSGGEKEHGWHSIADVDLVGEIKQSVASPQFQRGVTDYPAIGDPVLPSAPAS